METIIRWVRAAGGWVRSPYGDLPSLRVEDTSVHQTWLILAGGIGLILSRASRSELEERFAAAREVYAIARTRLQKRRLPKPDLHLLRDALHEIANLADPMTKEAGRECLARAVERAAAKSKGKGAAAASGISTLWRRRRPTPRNTTPRRSTWTCCSNAPTSCATRWPGNVRPLSARTTDPGEGPLNAALLLQYKRWSGNVPGHCSRRKGPAMGKAERERRHQTNLERIQRVQLVVGRADRMRVDHEGTLLERARLTMEEISSHDATERGLIAFERLLRLAEERDGRQTRDIVNFLSAVWNNKSLPLITLRGLEQSVGDDMVAVLDAFRYARLNLAEHVEGGPLRVERVVNKWRLAKA
jgi:hypothetical protein